MLYSCGGAAAAQIAHLNNDVSEVNSVLEVS